MCLNVSGEVESTNASEQYLHKPRSDMEYIYYFYCKSTEAQQEDL